MKKMILRLLLLCPALAFAECAEHLFYIDKSDNANVLYYDAAVTDGKLDKKNPVKLYWIMSAEKNQTEGRTMLEKPQFGIKVKEMEAEKLYQINVRNKNLSNRNIYVGFDENGCAIATTTVDGKEAFLNRIFVQISPNSGILPDVQHLDIFGTDIHSGEKLTERVSAK